MRAGAGFSSANRYFHSCNSYPRCVAKRNTGSCVIAENYQLVWLKSNTEASIFWGPCFIVTTLKRQIVNISNLRLNIQSQCIAVLNVDNLGT